MALKGQKTTSGFIQWETLTSLILKLQRDKENKFSLLISIGAFTGLRISDSLSLKWSQIMESDVIALHEMKTGKHRKIKINPDLQNIIRNSYKEMGEPDKNGLVFLNKYGTKAFNVQYVNFRLKEIFLKYGIKVENGGSSHSLRKSFGRRIWTLNDYSEKSLILLSELFNHSNVQITKRYLGIKEQELFDVYDSLSL